MDELINKFLCPGCVCGSSTDCESFRRKENPNGWVTCEKHHPGTFILGRGSIYLGMPKGFCRVGQHRYEDSKTLPVWIVPKDKQVDMFDHFNVPVWKTKHEGHTLVRGLRPRINEPFLMVFETQENFDAIQCFEVDEKLKTEMD